MMQKICTPEEQRLPEMIKEDILTVPTLSISDPYQIFYIKKEWYNDVMGAVIIQEEDSAEEMTEEPKKRTTENENLKSPWKDCAYYQCCFISRSTVSPLEKSRHIFVGEVATARWSIVNSIK